MGVGARHHHLTRLEGLTQTVEGLGAELRYYVASTPTGVRLPPKPVTRIIGSDT